MLVEQDAETETGAGRHRPEQLLTRRLAVDGRDVDERHHSNETAGDQRGPVLRFAVGKVRPAVEAFGVAAAGSAEKIAGCGRKIEIGPPPAGDEIAEEPEGKLLPAAWRQGAVRPHV